VHLVALVDSPTHVCCRYRLAAFRPYLEEAGHTLELCPLPRRWWSRWALFRRLRGASVVLQRRLLPRWELARLRRQVQWLVFDFDDAVFLRDSYSNRGLHDPRRLGRFAATVSACDAVVAGNGFLAEQAARWAGNHRVQVIPTCIDPFRYQLRRPDAAGAGRTLVWIGSSSTLQGLEAIAPLLEELGRRVPGLRLKVICDRFPRFESLPVDRCPWSAAGEAVELARGDIGISWIPDDLWSRGKCGLKVLQYMAAGLPVIANPVGVHPEMIRHGETGLLAATTDQWREAVIRLSGDTGLRDRLGQAGRRRVEAHYGVACGARAWLDVLERVAGAEALRSPGGDAARGFRRLQPRPHHEDQP
jgi:glycosyltransferase involved in cell wall biosynthesis